MVTNYDGEQIEIPSTLPMLPVRDIVVFPYMIIPLFVGRDSSIRSVEEALAKTDKLIFLSSQKNIADEQPTPDGIYETGTVAMIIRMRKLPDGRIKILTQGLCKARVKKFTQTQPFYEVQVDQIQELQTDKRSESEAIMRTIKEQLERMISLGKVLAPDIMMVLEDIQDPSRMADLVASNLGLKVSLAQEVLETHDPFAKLQKINELLNKETEVLSIQAKIRSQTKEITKSQKEYFLREQMKQIKSELGDNDPKSEEMNELREKILSAKMPANVEQETLKQLQRLERMHPESSEASMMRTYVEWMIDTPWSKASQDNLDLDHAMEILDDDHYKLEKIKERIIEFLAVRKLKGNNMKGPILCFSGPPGVGKTSLGKSIAKALGREFVRISLGGVKDEAEIRGHRRTYVGALPGRIIQGLKQAGTNNPVFILDELDKMGSDYKGDPSAALLEVLDPEQNYAFRDHYLNVAIDLTNVMFITTCNALEQIPAPLRDRMEVINLSGYTQEEKHFISRRYLIPKQVTENGLTNEQIEFTDEESSRSWKTTLARPASGTSSDWWAPSAVKPQGLLQKARPEPQ